MICEAMHLTVGNKRDNVSYLRRWKIFRWKYLNSSFTQDCHLYWPAYKVIFITQCVAISLLLQTFSKFH